ncbi:MAG: class I SAM-dependent DNA methyltransferase [Acidobacteriia bacterium]|nr:class I SAM-dependent DNA methyltransferase [Terriglobia bacterium]
MSLTLPEFVALWQKSTLTERSASQTHFNGLCDILGKPKPAESDPSGAEYTFEKGAAKSGGGQGWADVWKQGYFGWEYKGKRKNLDEAYTQLLQYREDLENPPLLITCDLNRFEVHTNFTNTAPKIYKFQLADLLSNKPNESCEIPPLDVLRLVFSDPSKLKPGLTTAQVTEEAAAQFSILAKSLRDRGVNPENGAHFLMRLLFCLFAESIGLLPSKVFSRLVAASVSKPADFDKKLKQLFAAMSSQGGAFGADDIPYFNGGLFSDDQTYPLSTADLEILRKASALDWAHVEPAIFGTLFERSLDPSKRSQLGAHYTSKDDILLIVEPVVMVPLRHRWEQIKGQAELLAQKAFAASGGARTGYRKKLRDLLMGFAEELANIKILDPACGSGNFLYVALKSILDLEKQVSTFAAMNGLSGLLPKGDPSQLYGIEMNVYAHELASVVVWIGYLQWQHDNGYPFGASPILRPLTNIKRMDAILAYDNSQPIEPDWPTVDYIIGNPPFLGSQKMRDGLGDSYVENLRTLYDDRLPGSTDFVTYWFEKARNQIITGKAKRAGLLATNSIRDGGSNESLKRIAATSEIFMAWSDREWILDGAAVRVSMVGFGAKQANESYMLDGVPVTKINTDLTSGVDFSDIKTLAENLNLSFQGPVKVGPFDISADLASEMLASPNPNHRPNSDVIKPTMNGSDIVVRPRNEWTIDFGEMELPEAALYEAPFEYLKKNVKPVREQNRDQQRRDKWWRLGRSGGDFKNARAGKSRVILTPRVAKHRLFDWAPPDVVPDTRVYAFARDDDYFFGVLHSRVHELWSLKTCSWHGVGNDPTYNNTTCFLTFPFPWVPGCESLSDAKVQAIAEAAKKLAQMRNAWLHPIGMEGTELKKRTLTNLYNEMPQWLQDLHKALDSAVLAAYGWPDNLSDAEILERLLMLNASRGSKDSDHTLLSTAPPSA